MTMKKFELEKRKCLKIAGKLAGAAHPDRFAQGAAALPDRREQRRLDQAAGLVPFACKLPSALVAQLHERAASYEGGLNALVTALLQQGV